MIPQITQLVEESWWNVTKYKYFVTLLKYIFHVSLLYLSKINRAYFFTFTSLHFAAIILLSTPLHFYNFCYIFITFSDRLT